MKTTITPAAFYSAFDRSGRDHQFSRHALRLIFNNIEQLEQDTGKDVELDVIGICCDYSESSASELVQAYSIDFQGDESEAVREYLNENTILIGETAGGFVYLHF